jgi:cell division GTPase FtsZ
MIRYGFLGLGQVGGLFVQEAKTIGYPVLAINTASIDLSLLHLLEAKEKLHLHGYEGAGKDRSIASDAFLVHADEIGALLKETFKNSQVIFTAFALGGGSGSGMSALVIEILTKWFPDKIICPIAFLPEQAESVRAKMNALEAFSEVSENEDIGAMFFVDNQKVLDLYHGHTLKERHRLARQELLQLLHELNQKTTQESLLGNVDAMDLLTVLSERGACMVSEIILDQQTMELPSLLNEKVQRSWEISVFAAREGSQIAKAAIIFDIPDAWTVQFSVDQAMFLEKKPLETFTGIYPVGKTPRSLMMISGMSYPLQTMKRFEEGIRKEEKQIVEHLNFVRSQSYEAKSSWTNALKRQKKVRV